MALKQLLILCQYDTYKKRAFILYQSRLYDEPWVFQSFMEKEAVYPDFPRLYNGLFMRNA